MQDNQTVQLRVWMLCRALDIVEAFEKLAPAK